MLRKKSYEILQNLLTRLRSKLVFEYDAYTMWVGLLIPFEFFGAFLTTR
jgi:hypothetical protein